MVHAETTIYAMVRTKSVAQELEYSFNKIKLGNFESTIQ